MITVGVFGAGTMGSVHARHAARMPDMKVKYICTPHPELGSGLADEIGAQYVNDAATVLNDPAVDLVILAYPTHVRREIIEPALNAGKYVFCEKPFAHAIDEAYRIAELCEQSDTWVSVGMVVRYFWEYKTMYDMLKSESLGRVGTIRTTRSCSSPRGYNNWFCDYQRSGGVILDLALHDIDFLCWTFGPVKRVYARGMRFAGVPGQDYALMVLRFESGEIAHVEGSWIERPNMFYTTIEVACEHGLIEYDRRKVNPLVFSPLKKSQDGQIPVVIPEAPTFESPYETELKAVANAIRTHAPAPVPVKDALPAVEVAFAAMKSIQTKEPVTLS